MVAIPSMIEGKDRFRSVALMVVADEIAVETDIRLVTATEIAHVAKALEDAVVRAAGRVGVFPETVLVRRHDVAEALRPLLRDRGCGVGVESILPGLDLLSRDLVEHLTGQSSWPAVAPPPTWAAWGLPPGLVKDLFSAYARFYEAAPWRWLDFAPPVLAEWSDGEDPWVVSVMGSSMGEYGLAIYSHPWDFEETLAWEEDEPPFQELEGWVVHLGYQQRGQVGRAMLREIAQARWEVAGPAAYPFIMPLLTPGGGLQKDQVRRMTELLRGVASLSDERGERLRSPEGVEVEKSDGRLTLRYAVEPEGEASPSRLPPELEEILEGLERGDFGGLEEARVELERRMDRYHATPQEALAGLSPDQAQALLYERLDGAGHLRFSENLTLEELESGDFPFHCRVFLARLEETGGAPATAAGNLKRVFVAEMLERMRFRDRYLEDLHRMNKVVNEADVWPLHVVRVNLELAGLIRRRKGTFLLTRKGRSLVSPEAAGELFRHLFLVHFGEFDLRYGRRLWSELDLQAAMPLLIWQVGVWARDWVTVQALSVRLLPESRPDADNGGDASLRQDISFLHSILLEPLEGFGLLEERDADPQGESEDRRWRWRPEALEVRITPLFHRFLSFRWEEPGASPGTDSAGGDKSAGPRRTGGS
jgi:hypothetical protein